MLGSSSTAAATLSTNISSATPTSPSRPSRLRGLSYLRNYTLHHLHTPLPASAGGNLPPPLIRTASTPADPSLIPIRSRRSLSQSESREALAPALSPRRTEGQSTNGWVPSVGGQSGLSRVATQPLSTATHSSPAEPVALPTMTKAGPTTDGESTDTPERATANGHTVAPSSSARDAAAGPGADRKDSVPSIRFIPHHEPRATRPSLSFPIIARSLATPASIVRVGRYSERDGNTADALANPRSTAPVGFKSKVVSRRHCEFWCSNNQWYIKDVKSSSGTFLNHVRLSSPGSESRPYPVNDGDIVQLGIDFKGGEEVIFRCVKIRIECNRGWQKSLNQFNTQTHQRLRNLGKPAAPAKDSDAQSVNNSECSICLNPVAPCQALFVAPCSHVWHYKCVRNLIYPNWPTFQCPNCRAYADLEAEVDQPEQDDTDGEIEDAIKQSQESTESNSEAIAAEVEPSLDAADDALDRTTQAVSSSSSQPAAHEEDDARLSAATTRPVSIARPSTPIHHHDDPISPRSATPRTTDTFALAAGLQGPEGPMTPTNDAGPFVLDGSAGRSREIGPIAQELDEDAAARST